MPEGGSLAVSFVVVNKGSWAGDSTVINALELAGSAVLGALTGRDREPGRDGRGHGHCRWSHRGDRSSHDNGPYF